MHGILHIGTRKTGSTSIQRFLRINRDKLLDQGILAPHSIAENGFELAVSADPMMRLWYYTARENIRTQEDLEKFRARTRERLFGEIEETRPRTVILSSEDLSFYIHDEQTRFLREFLTPFSSFTVICYLRRQDRYVVSDISTGLLNGGRPFTLKGDPKIVPHLDYKRLLDAWAGAFGRAALDIRVFERDRMVRGDLIDDFSAAAGIDLTGLERPKISNPSVTSAAQAFLRIANEQLPGVLPSGEFNWQRGPLNRVLIKHYGDGRPPKPPRAEAEAFYDHFRDSNAALRATYFPDSDRPVFDESFDDYPEQGEEAELSFADGADLAIRLWSEAQEETARLRRENRRLRHRINKGGGGKGAGGSD